MFWRQMGFADEAGVEIVLLNHQAVELELEAENAGRTQFSAHPGDARSMPEFADASFDIVVR